MNVSRRPAASAVKQLLEEAKLPSSDLPDAHLAHFFGCGSAQHLDGVIGLEFYTPVALLRSLAVAPRSRERGVGSALVAHAERHARSQGVAEIYLLTTTAPGFFERAGYERIAREQAPGAIRHTTEFSSLCPASAVLLRKRLG
jgi:N-acetylglutamate synthase-like GNAT family acetyltransferase